MSNINSIIDALFTQAIYVLRIDVFREHAKGGCMFLKKVPQMFHQHPEQMSLSFIVK
jgi:hypothetical protein